MAKKYITNSGNYYFEVEQEIDESLLEGCIIHISERAMHVHVVKELNLSSLEEVEGGNLFIRDGQCFDSRGCPDDIDGSIEEFINCFVM